MSCPLWNDTEWWRYPFARHPGATVILASAANASRRQCTAGCPSGQWERTVNPSRELRRFEPFTRHTHTKRPPNWSDPVGGLSVSVCRGEPVRVAIALYGQSPYVPSLCAAILGCRHDGTVSRAAEYPEDRPVDARSGPFGQLQNVRTCVGCTDARITVLVSG
jgi:hypothetical protein